MPTLERIRKSIATAEELQSVARTMKGVAAASIRRFERAVTSLGEYTRTVELALQALLSQRPWWPALGPPEGERTFAAVVFGSDQGMCGRFNQLIAEHAVDDAGRRAPDDGARSVLVVGARVGPLLAGSGLGVDAQAEPANSLAGIGGLVQGLLTRLQQWRAAGRADRIVLYYNEATGGASYRPTARQLYPVDLDWLGELSRRPWPSRRLPMHVPHRAEMLPALVREFFYVWLFRAAAESLTSENASRLASMQAAERNIEERLGELTLRFRLWRQESITAELLDIVSGFEALSSPGR